MICSSYAIGVRPEQTKKLWAAFDQDGAGFVHFNDLVETFSSYVGGTAGAKATTDAAGSTGYVSYVFSQRHLAHISKHLSVYVLARIFDVFPTYLVPIS